MHATLRHPLGLTLLGASLLLAAATLVVPALAPWSARVPWLLLLGLLAYAVAAIASHLPRSKPSGPELGQLQAIRQAMQVRLVERRAAGVSDTRSELMDVLSEAIVQLDTQAEPALRQLLERQEVLTGYLARIERGDLPAPSPEVLARLQAVHTRQQAAVDECVQQVADAAGMLEVVLQDSDDPGSAAHARTWTNDLLTLYDGLEAALRGGGDEDARSGSLELSGAPSPLVGLLKVWYATGKIDQQQYEHQLEVLLRPSPGDRLGDGHA